SHCVHGNSCNTCLTGYHVVGDVSTQNDRIKLFNDGSYMTGKSTPTLILLHGATCNGRMWDALRRGLDPKLQVLAPDLPGHGSRRGEPYTLQGAVDTVVQ